MVVSVNVQCTYQDRLKPHEDKYIKYIVSCFMIALNHKMFCHFHVIWSKYIEPAYHRGFQRHAYECKYNIAVQGMVMWMLSMKVQRFSTL